MATNYTKVKQMLISAMSMIEQGSLLYDSALEMADNTNLTKKQNDIVWSNIIDFYDDCLKTNQFVADIQACKDYSTVMERIGA
jgi:hypothetical protein